MVSMAKVACSEIEPLGSKYPNSRVSRSKNHSEYGFWDLKPYYLGTWTLWVIDPNTELVGSVPKSRVAVDLQEKLQKMLPSLGYMEPQG